MGRSTTSSSSLPGKADEVALSGALPRHGIQGFHDLVQAVPGNFRDTAVPVAARDLTGMP